MAIGLRYTYKKSEFLKSMQGIKRAMEVAAYSSVVEAGKLAVVQGDAHVAAKGFPRGFRSRVEPKQPSMAASATVTHRVGRLGVFEHGGTIVGKPLLWLPIEANLPRARRWTPSRFSARFGKLVSARGSRPILVGTVRGQTVPVFHGVKSVNIRKRLDFAGVVDRIVVGLVDIYNKHLKF